MNLHEIEQLSQRLKLFHGPNYLYNAGIFTPMHLLILQKPEEEDGEHGDKIGKESKPSKRKWVLQVVFDLRCETLLLRVSSQNVLMVYDILLAFLVVNVRKRYQDFSRWEGLESWEACCLDAILDATPDVRARTCVLFSYNLKLERPSFQWQFSALVLQFRKWECVALIGGSLLEAIWQYPLADLLCLSISGNAAVSCFPLKEELWSPAR